MREDEVNNGFLKIARRKAAQRRLFGGWRESSFMGYGIQVEGDGWVGATPAPLFKG
jgi:hypothetical protein